MSKVKDINSITYLRVVNGVFVELEGIKYAPSRKVLKDELIKITCMPRGATMSGKRFIIVDDKEYWYEI